MKQLKIIWDIICPYVIVIMGIVIGLKFIVFFAPFIVGGIISLIAMPMIKFLNEKTHIMKRKHASVMVVGILISLIVFILYIAGASLVGTGIQIAKEIPGYVKDTLESIENSGIIEKLPVEAQKILNDVWGNMSKYITGLVSPVANMSLDIVRSLPVMLVNLIVAVFVSFIFCTDGDRYIENIKNSIPNKIKTYGDLIKSDIKSIMSGWLLAQFKIMFIVFLVLAVGFISLHVQYGIFLAALTAFLDFLPLLGVGFIMWPWIGIELINMNWNMVLWLSIIYIATQVVRRVLEPKIMGDTMGLTPFKTILFMYLGFKIYGIGGMIFAVPIGMGVMCLYRYGLFDKSNKTIKDLLEEK